MPVVTAGVGIGIMSQFRGSALWSIVLGLVSIVVPFVLGYVFFFLPFVGIYYGIRAIRRGQLAGGLVGIFLCCIGGLITILSRVVH
jgi:hypothetical protein